MIDTIPVRCKNKQTLKDIFHCEAFAEKQNRTKSQEGFGFNYLKDSFQA